MSNDNSAYRSRVDRAMSSVLNKIPVNGYKIEMDYAGGEVSVGVPEEELEAVFFHLMRNALESMEDGTMRLATRMDDGYVCASVADTGRGIDPAIREKVYDPFFTTKTTRSSLSPDFKLEYEHLGLGLAITKDIVERHGGSIDFESELGKGTEFRVRLPALE